MQMPQCFLGLELHQTVRQGYGRNKAGDRGEDFGVTGVRIGTCAMRGVSPLRLTAREAKQEGTTMQGRRCLAWLAQPPGYSLGDGTVPAGQRY